MYIFFAAVGGEIGLQRSPWISSSARDARYEVALGNACLACFPSKHHAHVSFSFGALDIPTTSSFITIDFIVSKLMCPSRACHLVESLDATSCRHFVFSTSKFTLYNLFFDRFALTNKFPLRLCKVK